MIAALLAVTVNLQQVPNAHMFPKNPKLIPSVSQPFTLCDTQVIWPLKLMAVLIEISTIIT